VLLKNLVGNTLFWKMPGQASSSGEDLLRSCSLPYSALREIIFHTNRIFSSPHVFNTFKKKKGTGEKTENREAKTKIE